MEPRVPSVVKQVLSEKLAESLTRPLPDATQRRVHGALTFPGKATAVVGVRRGGKTTFLHQMRRDRLSGGVLQERLPYVNFEDERLAGVTSDHLTFLVEEHARRFPHVNEQDTVIWSFDEVQVVPGWERFVRRILDTGRCEVRVTGSSAALLSREIATALRGRAWEVPIYPFSFAEALRHQGQALPDDTAFLTAAQRGRIEAAFERWLSTGGFPEAQKVSEPERYQLLRDYVDVAMLRDVVERHNVTNVTGLRWLVRHLLGNAAAPFSVEKFHKALKSGGVAISRDTVHEQLGHLEDCFLVRVVWLDTASERRRMVNPRKVYPVDAGLIPVFDRTGRSNRGHALETAVLIELERRRRAVSYVKTPSGHEVDFVTRDATGRLELLQVCADASDPQTADRELRALVEAAALYPDAALRLLTLTRDGMPAESPANVEVQPAYQWMLSEPEPVSTSGA